MTLTSDVRTQLLGTDDSAVLSDAYVALHIADAKDFTGITDETSKALRYYVCHLIALNWDSIGAIAKRENVEYRAPDADKYLAKYNEACASLLTNDNISAYGPVKVSTDRDYTVDTDGYLVKGDDTNL